MHYLFKYEYFHYYFSTYISTIINDINIILLLTFIIISLFVKKRFIIDILNLCTLDGVPCTYILHTTRKIIQYSLFLNTII